ncbi:MAG: FIST C-terminal domain-containing protein [Clostridiales Family XIII bacterium]|jgi:hypothetical protein|nr:FIST C-terminal domain-containing protein [Clostridiales Family XIII bacterium]
MIKVRTAHTDQINNPAAAIEDILSQLKIDSYIRTNSIAIVTCNSEYFDSDFLDLLATYIPCQIIGITSIASSTSSGMGIYSCSITLLTSYENEFTFSYSDTISETRMDEVITKAYYEAAADHDEKPSMILVYAPSVSWNIDCAEVVAALDKASGGVPAFGSFSIDHTADFMHNRTIYGNEYSWDRVGLVLVYGELNPTYFVASISDRYINKHIGVVTRAEGRTVYEVDGEPFVDFLIESGVIVDGEFSVVKSPVLVDFQDGATPVMRGIANITDEGNGVFNSVIPTGAILRMTEINATDVLEGAELIINASLSVDHAEGMLVYPCISRFAALSEDNLAEMATAANLIGNQLPYMISYSGGEICPVAGPNGTLVNKLHNSTIISCVF